MTNPSALYLPGTSGNYVSTPDDASLDMTTTLSVIAHVTMPDWTPTNVTWLVCKGTSTDNDRSYFFAINTDGKLRLLWSTIGTYNSSYDHFSTVAPTVSNGEDLWIGVTRDSSTVRFWTSTDGSSWSQLGSDVAAPTGNFYNAGGGLGVGNVSDGVTTVDPCIIHYAAVYSGVGANTAPGLGTLVAELRTDAPIEPRYRDSTGKIWTFNGSAFAWQEVS